MARGRFNFYLNFQKDDELLVAERIDDLKRRRSFTSVVREGIIIISELREGRVDTLLRLYPWIVDVIRTPQPPPPDDGDLKHEISLLRKLILEQGSIQAPPRDYPQMKQSGAGIGTLGTSRQFTLPMVDEDNLDDTIVLNKATASTNSNAAMASMMKVMF